MNNWRGHGIAVRLLVAAALWLLSVAAALALETINIASTDTALDLSGAVEIHRGNGGQFQVSTVAGADGIVRRIEVEATRPQTAGNWAVFALANNTDRQIDRLIVAPHFRLVGSRFFWPDLGSKRITAITPSEGFALDRVSSPDADVFSITLNPGSVITFVAELAAPDLPQVYLWEPDAYKDTVNSYTLYRGIVIGIAGLLALFLTILFVVKGTAMFPATAALAWAVLAYVSIDFGFLSKVIAFAPGNEQVWRAVTETGFASTLVLFLFAYLNLNRWHNHLGYATMLWFLGLMAVLGLAFYEPPKAAGIARLSLAATAVVGLALIVFLGFRRYDRAIMLIPSWLLILAWLAGGWMTVDGRIDNDIIQPALAGGLVLIVLLIGFTVMQHAFAGGAFSQGLFSDMERQALAVSGSGGIVWDWDVLRDRILTNPPLSEPLGLPAGTFSGPARTWLPYLHPDDRDRFRATLDILLEHRRGRLSIDFRLRARDGRYVWYALRARPVVGSDGEVIRCIGTITNVTDQKHAEERLLHDAVHDNLTGLPNRELFIDRLDSIIALSRADEKVRPSVFVVDMDRFKQVNDSLGMSAGDTLLLTIARRLKRILKPHDTLSRLSGNQFGLLLVSETEVTRIAAFAEALNKVIRKPITYGDREIVLTASIGLATATAARESGQDLLRDAELAMFQAKRFGGDRIEPFRPAFRTAGTDRLQLESDLRRALERGELRLVYQPIVRLTDGHIAGFEALMRWEHPRRGSIPPAEFIPIAEKSGLMVPLGTFAMENAIRELARWQDALGAEPVFVSVNLSSSQIIRHDLVGAIRSLQTRSHVKPGTFKLELTETVLMENPEQNARILVELKRLGVGLSLDDFGTGYSSLAYLSRFPFDMLKIDRSFVTDLNRQRRTLLHSMITMAHDLGLQVVVEGAESAEDVELLQDLGAEFSQGYFHGEPVSGDMVVGLVRGAAKAEAA